MSAIVPYPASGAFDNQGQRTAETRLGNPNAPHAYEIVSDTSPDSTSRKVIEVFCSACHKLIEDLPPLISKTTPHDTLEGDYQYPIEVVNTPLKLAQAMLKRFGDNLPLKLLLQYCIDYPASVSASFLKSAAPQAWSQDNHDVSVDRQSRSKNAVQHRETYAMDATESHTDDINIKVFPCGHAYHSNCLSNVSDCSMLLTCAKVAALFPHKGLVLNFNPSPAQVLPTSSPEKNSAGKCAGNVGYRFWGAGSVANLSDWKKYGIRRSVTLLTAAAGLATLIALQFKKATNPDEEGCAYDQATVDAYQSLMPDLDTLSYLNQTAKGAYVQLKGLNTSSCDTMATVTTKVVNYLDANGISAVCKQTILPLLNPLAALSVTSQTIGVVWDYLSAAQTNSACVSGPMFSRGESYTAGNGSFGITVADFNGDDKLDLALPNIYSNDVSVLLGKGDGTFRAAVNYEVGPPISTIGFGGAVGIVPGDFNRDGKSDLAVANNIANATSILLGNGDGTFQVPVNYAVGRSPYGITVSDFNRDGKLDLAVTNYPNGVSVLLGKGDGTFQGAVNYEVVSTSTNGIAVSDFNRDGNPDLALSASYPGAVSILLGNGDGTFQTAVSYGAGLRPITIVAKDFNKDGKPDLAVANYGSQSVSVLLGAGNGTFGTAVNYGVGPSPFRITTSDFNRDGKPDLTVANRNSNDISVLLGVGDGTFQAAVNYTVGVGPSGIAAGDFNRDGKPDLVVANFTEVLALLNAD